MKTLSQSLLFLILCNLDLAYSQWIHTNAPSAGNIYSIANTGASYFAASQTAGILKSTNNGNDWNLADTGLAWPEYTSFAVNGSNLFAGASRTGVFLSTDAGTSWNAINAGLTGVAQYIYSLVVSGSNIFAGTYMGGAYLSTNNGASWTAVNNGMTDSVVFSLAVNGGNLFAGTQNDGVFLSTNNGSSWTAVNSGLADKHMLSFAINGSNIFAGCFYGGVYLSTNNGTSWTSKNVGLSNGHITALAIRGTNVLAGTEGGGVFLSTDNGNNWNPVNGGMTNTKVYSLLISGTSLLAGTEGGIWIRPLPQMIPDYYVKKVPSQYSTIQAALNAAQSGDTVLVRPGTYHENIFWPNVNGIKLLSGGDTTNTLIDGRNLSCVVYISPTIAIDTTTLIQGFKITGGGNVSYGGGIFLKNASPILKYLSVCRNSAGIRGGGIFCDTGSSIQMLGSAVTNNSAVNEGGGIYLLQPLRSTLRDVLVINNTNTSGGLTFDGGGGIYAEGTGRPDCKLSLTNVTVQNNTSWKDGGGILAHYVTLDVTDCLITGNVCNEYGAGLYTQGDSLHIRSTVFSANRATLSYGMGGGAFFDRTTVIASGLTVRGNSAGYMGGGLNCYYDADATISGSTFIYNQAKLGGALSLINATINQVEISGNDANDGGGIWIEGNGTTFLNRVNFNNNVGQKGACLYTGTNTVMIKSSNFTTSNSNGIEPMIYRSSGNLTITQSDFIAPGYAIYNDDNSSYVTATDNWWGNTSGPYHPIQNPSGTGDSVNSFVNATPFLTAPDTTAPPVSPQNLRFTNIGATSVSLAWDSSLIGDLSGYKVYYSADSSAYPYTNVVDVGNVTLFKLTGLTSGVKYYIVVTCYDKGGNESWYSNDVSATPAFPILVALSSISFGNVAKDSTSAVCLRITDASGSRLVIDSIYTKTSKFKVDSSKGSVGQTDTLKLTVRFTPGGFGTFTDTLYFHNNSATPLVKMPLSGNSPAPSLSISARSISFGNIALVDTGYRSIALFNGSLVNSLTVTRIAVNVPAFTFHTMNSPLIINANDSSTITVRFNINSITPSGYGIWRDTLYISSDGGNANIAMVGFSPKPAIAVSATSISFGTVHNDSAQPKELIVRDTSVNPLKIDTLWTGTKYFAIRQGLTKKLYTPHDTLRIIIGFTPDSTRSYTDTLFISNYSQSDYQPSLLKIILTGNGTSTSIVQLGNEIPEVFMLYQNYPNPFNPSTRIRFGIPRRSSVRVMIYNILGQEITELVNQDLDAGYYEKLWYANVASGLYVYRIEAVSASDPGKRFVNVKKMILLK